MTRKQLNLHRGREFQRDIINNTAVSLGHTIMEYYIIFFIQL